MHCIEFFCSVMEICHCYGNISLNERKEETHVFELLIGPFVDQSTVDHDLSIWR